MKISSLPKSILILVIVIFIRTSVETSVMSPICDSSQTDFEIDSTAKHRDRKQIYFFIGSLISVVDTTSNRIDSTRISDYSDFWANNKEIIKYVDIAESATKSLHLYTHYTNQLSYKYTTVDYNSDKVLFQGDGQLNEQMLQTLDKDLDLSSNNTYYFLIKKPQTSEQLEIGIGVDVVYNIYPLRIRLNNGRYETAIVSNPSDPSFSFYQLKSHNISSLIVLPNDMSNDLFRNDSIILFANRYLVRISKQLDVWSPFEVINFAKIVCQKQTTITPTPVNTTQQNPINTSNKTNSLDRIFFFVFLSHTLILFSIH